MRIMGKFLWSIISNTRDDYQSEKEFLMTCLFSLCFLWTKKQAMSVRLECHDVEEQFILRLPPVSNFYIPEYISSVQKYSSA
jgi:hypothetical protein